MPGILPSTEKPHGVIEESPGNSHSETDLWRDYSRIRAESERLAEPLTPEDQCLQSMPDASPTKWHLAHTSWFFETFLLEEFVPRYRCFHPDYKILFNSYYNQIGEQYSRANRGLISRPCVEDIATYRAHIDEQMRDLLDGEISKTPQIRKLVTLGLNHEQQHQELLLTDIKHAFSYNPTCPKYSDTSSSNLAASQLSWTHFDAGIYKIGCDDSEFHFDNESPSHRVFQESFSIASRPVTNLEFIEFIKDGGYHNHEFWLSEGWTWVNDNNLSCPLYWSSKDEVWEHYTLGGRKAIVLDEPVIHLSYFEADAFARWSGARLPTEQEWEIAASGSQIDGVFLDPARCHPGSARDSYFGDVWNWTSSSYSAYPGFKIAEGAVGEYNGKFMCNQYVLRGGSCATPPGHIRDSYRNFFPATSRWQFSGLRLAKDAH